MAAIVYQTDKKTIVTYAYESIAYWDKEKKQSRAKRKCTGKVDPKTQKIIPTRKRQLPEVSQNLKPGPVLITRTKRSFYGATYLFDRIGEDTGVTEDLKTCFPDSYRQILSIAHYLILEECFEVPGQRLQVGETTKRQMELYTTFGVMPPASLH